jgi:hypothetical protein
MSLEYTIFKLLYEKSLEGGRQLAPNEFRMSHFADCSWELFFSKIYPESVEEGTPLIIKDKHTGVVTPVSGKAVAGTLLHEALQFLLKDYIVEAERKISKTITSPEYPDFPVLLSGHVDIDYAEDERRFVVVKDGKKNLMDIKSLSTNNFEEIVGIKTMEETSYSATKVKKATPQANAYAYLSDLTSFSIMWLDKDSLRYKFEHFPIDPVGFAKGIDKMAEVLYCVAKYQDGDTEIRPKFCGITMCNYCDAFRRHCLGSKKLKSQGLV